MTMRLAILILVLGSLPEAIAQVFEPKNHLGTWAGNLEISNPGKMKSIPMQLEITATGDTNRWGWTLIYETEKPDRREYELVIRDKQKGEFLIDERNSILLPGQFLSNKLIQQFEVDGNMITCIFTFFQEGIIFEIISASTISPVKSGGVKDIPLVNGIQVNGYQVAYLSKRI
jgi:hypothetical protein